MKSKETLLMQRRVEWYLNYIKGEGNIGVNSQFTFDFIDCSFEDKTLKLAYKTEDWMLNPGHVVHGGMISTMFDITMGINAMSASGTFSPTVNLNISYLSPLPNNDVFVVSSRATRVGRNFVQLVAEGIVESSNEIAATATAIFYCGGNDKLVFEDE